MSSSDSRIGRHVVTTAHLQTWDSYKSWTEQVQNSWEPGAEEAPEAAEEPGPEAQA